MNLLYCVLLSFIGIKMIDKQFLNVKNVLFYFLSTIDIHNLERFQSDMIHFITRD